MPDPKSGDDDAPAIVLYVEDNAANLELMHAILSRVDGVVMNNARTAELALVEAEENPPALILMDINLPGMNGIEAFIELQKRPALKDIPVIAISANAMPHDIDRAMEVGFESYLTKPFDVQNVIAEVKKHLGI